MKKIVCKQKRKMITEVFLLISILFATTVSDAKKLEVRFKEKVAVPINKEILLEDLLFDSKTASMMPKNILKIPMYESISSETQVAISGLNLAQKIRTQLTMQDLQLYSFRFPEQTLLNARRNFISEEKIKTQILQRAMEICQNCEVEFEDFQLDTQNIRGEILAESLTIENLRGGGNFLIPYNLETSQGRIQRLVSGKILFFKMGWVAKRWLPPGAIIKKEDFTQQKVNVTYAKDALNLDLESEGKVLNKALNMSQPLFISDLKQETLAQRGQTVKILIEGDHFEVATEGVAEQGGVLGDMIMVKNLSNQKSVSAVIIDKGVVRLK